MRKGSEADQAYSRQPYLGPDQSTGDSEYHAPAAVPIGACAACEISKLSPPGRTVPTFCVWLKANDNGSDTKGTPQL